MCLYIAGMLRERAEGGTSAVLPRSSIPELTAPLGSSELWAHFQAAVQASFMKGPPWVSSQDPDYIHASILEEWLPEQRRQYLDKSFHYAQERDKRRC